MIRVIRGLLIVWLGILAGCTLPTLPGKWGEPAKPADWEARQLHMRGNYQGAAQAYLTLAGQTRDVKTRQKYQVTAAELWVRANQPAAARQQLAAVGELQDPQLILRTQLTLAEAEIQENQSNQALERLQKLQNTSMTPYLQAVYRRIQAQALERSQRFSEAAQMRAYLDTLLSKDSDLRNNHQALWQDLMHLPPTRPPADAKMDDWHGWLTLAFLMKTTHPDYREQALAYWRQRYPNHPAQRTIAMPPEQGPGMPVAMPRVSAEAAYQGFKPHIALLLPLSGKLRIAGEIVRDGFSAAWYLDDVAKRPVLRVYDTDRAPVAGLYQQALNQGANLVVGPLDKEQVAGLANALSARAPVPTLTLNVLDESLRNARTTPTGFYQFGLSPEDEAQQVAQWMWQDGRRTVAALAPEGVWGERMLSAFISQWEYLGGQVTDYRTFSNENIDAPVRNIARQRKSLDAVFLAAFPLQGRRIKPQFKYYFANSLPLYATSHIYSGIPDASMDYDLNRVVFLDMPWRLRGAGPHPQGAPPPLPAPDDLHTLLQNQWPERMTSAYQGLFALGIDAYHLVQKLRTPPLTGTPLLAGETGTLHADARGIILRSLRQVRFHKGLPEVLNAVAAPAVAEEIPESAEYR